MEKGCRKLAVVFAAVMIMAGSGRTFAYEVGGQEIAVTAAVDYVTRYVWRGQDLYGNNDGAFQPSIDVSFPGLLAGTDVGINVWGSFASKNGHEGGDELDYTISFGRELLDGALSASAGYTYFDYPNLNDMADVQEPWLSLTVNEIPVGFPLSFSLFFGYDINAKNGGPENGWYYSWSFDTELALPESLAPQEGQVITFGIVNWGNDGPAGLEPSFLYATDFSVGTEFVFGQISVSPGICYTINHEEKINSGDEEFWFTLSLSYAF